MQKIKSQNQIVKVLTNRVLTIYKDGNWVQKVELPEGKIGLGIGKEMVYSEK